MKITAISLLSVWLTIPAMAQVRVAGQEIVPKGLIFADADPKSRVVAEAGMRDECSWVFEVQTRFAEQRAEGECFVDHRWTTATLRRKCGEPTRSEPIVSERITAAPRSRCPDEKGEIEPVEIESRTISSGTTPDGKRQAIVEQPDGTRLTLSWDTGGARAVLRFPDGTSDLLTMSAEKREEAGKE